MKKKICFVILAAVFEIFLPRPAHAIIGRPLTPLSFAGVARRTTRRAVYAGAAAGAYGAYGVYGAPVVAAPVAARPVVVW
jgi:hypothetical protein